MAKLYSGELRLDEDALQVNYGTGKTIFVEHMNDLFANGVKLGWIAGILDHCGAWPDNIYVFQTKNTDRVMMQKWIFNDGFGPHIRADKDMFGTTIETNRDTEGVSKAPQTFDRIAAIKYFRQKYPRMTLFITVEPVLDFDVDVMLEWMHDARPSFINIGADSKGAALEEPSAAKLKAFIAGVQEMGIEIRHKTNLDRILKGGRK